MAEIKKIFSNYNGQTPSTGKEVEEAFNENFENLETEIAQLAGATDEKITQLVSATDEKITQLDAITKAEKNGWLADGSLLFTVDETRTIGYISGMKLRIRDYKVDDVYSINQFIIEGDRVRISIFKNGSAFVVIYIDDYSSSNYRRYYGYGSIIEIWHNPITVATHNSSTSKVIISHRVINHFNDEYMLSLSYEVIKAVGVDEVGNVTLADVKWSDGATGVYTATDENATFACYDGYTITHSLSSKILTQSKVTRNDLGVVTVKPALTINNN